MKKRGILLVLFLLISTIDATTSTRMVVDFDNTALESNLRAGDSGILNLVISNTGGFSADNVEVLLSGTSNIPVDKSFSIGTVTSAESKSIPVLLRVSKDVKSGLSAIPVTISFDGYDSEGDRKNNIFTTWEIPIRIYGDPLFQITPSETTYYKDNLDDLNLQGKLLDSVKDLQTTLSSDCVTVIGSSRKFLGDVNSNKSFNLTYQIKPSSSGACAVSLLLRYTDESGNSASDNVSIGLNIEEAGVDFKVVNISYLPTGPGETTAITIGLKNTGKSDSKDTALSLSLTDPFVPVDTAEKYIGTVTGGQTVYAEFKIAVSWDAETKPYSIPLNITYKVGGTSYSVKKDIGVDVSGKIILEIINIESSRGTIRVEVANIGTRTADGVKATLVVGDTGEQDIPSGMRFTGNRTRHGNISQTGGTQLVSYKSDIKSNKQTTFTFQTQASGPALLTLEYTGLNNERVTQRETITLPRGVDFTGMGTAMRGRGTSTTKLAFYAIIVLVVVFAAYRRYKHEKILPEFVTKKLHKLRKSE